MNTELMFSSKSHEWGTPLDFYHGLADQYGPFDLDPATDPTNPLGTPNFFTPKDDGLAQPWSGRVFCNPPYGRETGRWVAKAVAEVEGHRASRVVMLLPARTDTQWFHRWIYKNPLARVIFLRGRLTFVGAPYAAPFPSMVVIFEHDVSPPQTP